MKTYNKAIYTYWNPNKNGAGFNNIEDFLYCFSLSANISLKHFDKIEVYSDSWGKELLESLELPIIINNELDCLDDINSNFWAYAKIYSYSRQREPFIHIDNDVILWDGIPDLLQNKQFVFQNKETFEKSHSYEKSILQSEIILPIKKTVKYGLNAGIFGSYNFDIIKEYEQLAYEYITKNSTYILSNCHDLFGQNILFEQYFIAYLIDSHGLNSEIGTLFEPDLANARFTGVYNYTHLWSKSKRNADIVKKVKERLIKDFPSTAQLIK